MNLTPQLQCPICGTQTNSETVSTNPVFANPLPIAYCIDCQLYYTASLPDEHYLTSFYAHDYFEQSRKTPFHYRLKKLFADMRAQSQYRYISRYCDVKTPGRVLEIGAADGTFLSHYKNKNWDITGYEYNEYMIEQAHKRFGIILHRQSLSDTTNGQLFDHIVLLHVLEHMRDPQETLETCRQILRDDGLLYIELPHSPMPSEVAQETLDYYLGTTHLYNFRPDSLIRLCEKAGYSVVNLSRYFYPVPFLFASSSYAVGRMLMNGTVHSFRITDLAALSLTCLRMIKAYYLYGEVLHKIAIDSPWVGVGDNLRIILKKN